MSTKSLLVVIYEYSTDQKNIRKGFQHVKFQKR